jgi:hypothetical protein
VAKTPAPTQEKNPVSETAVSAPVDDITTYITTQDQEEYTMPANPQRPQLAKMQWMKKVQIVAPEIKEYTGGAIRVEQDRDLDAVLEGMQTSRVTIEHQSDDHERVDYWLFPEIRAYVLCREIAHQAAHTLEEAAAQGLQTGIAHVWNEFDNSSYFECLLLLSDMSILEHYQKPIVFSLRRMVVPVFIEQGLKPLFEMHDELRAANARIYGEDSEQAQKLYGSYSHWQQFVVGPQVKVGNGGQTAYIRGPKADIPKPLTGSFLTEHKIPAPVKALVERYMKRVPSWAQEVSLDLMQPPRYLTKKQASPTA